MTHLLVTNDFPPKVGGIQSYLWELWRRLPPGRAVIVTTSYPGSEAFDAGQPFRIERLPERVLWPHAGLARRVGALAAEAGAGLVLLDPALPAGLLGPSLACPFGVVLHGAEVTVPARLPGTRAMLRRVLRQATVVIAGGAYPAAEAARVAGDGLPVVAVPPGVDLDRFRPRPAADRARARAAVGLADDARVVLGLSRLVPRKGLDVLVAASALLAGDHPDMVVAVAGTGRDRRRLERLAAASRAPVRFLGAVADHCLPDLMAAADVFAMPCRTRWGGLEQEGFGVVFLEAAASGVPQVAGRSGGADDAVVDGVTGAVVSRPDDPAAVAAALAPLLDDPGRRAAQGAASRRRVEEHFSYDRLAGVLADSLAPFE